MRHGRCAIYGGGYAEYMTDTDELRELAIAVAREAGALALRRQREGVHIAATKSAAADIVTQADREVEALIRERVLTARPGDGFFGEEGGDSDASSSGITWIVDPIDGTVNYAFGLPVWAVSVAAVGLLDPDSGVDSHWPTGQSSGAAVAGVRAQDSLVGVVVVPVLGEEFVAVRGQGATLNGSRIHVAEPPTAGAMLATGFGYDPATHPDALATITRVMPIARDLRRMGACAVDLAYVAAGRLDGYFERGVNLWDYAAARLLVTEAGGRFGVFPPDDFGRDLVVAGSETVFSAVVDRLDVGSAG